MHGLEGNDRHERLAAGAALVDKLDHLVDVVPARVKIGRQHGGFAVLPPARIGIKRRVDLGFVVVSAGLLQRHVAVPAARTGAALDAVADVPLAGVISGVPGITHQLAETVDVVAKVAFIAGLAFLVRRDHRQQRAGACAVVVDPRLEHDPRGLAGRRGVEVRETHTLLRERIDHRCRDLAAIRSEVAETSVVDEHEHDVRPSGRRGVGGRAGRGAQQRCP